MGLRQLSETVRRIVRSPWVGTADGLLRHGAWQVRRVARRFPVDLPFSDSVIRAWGPRGAGALVNAFGVYDPNNMRLIRLLLKDGGCLWDIGANIGTYTVYAAEEPTASVVAFEPHPTTYSQLQENIALNRLEGRVTAVPWALGAERGTATLSDTADSSLNHLLPDGSGAIPVRIERALDVAAEHPPPTVVKMDVEGFEADVLAGFDDALAAGVEAWFVEINHLGDTRGEGEGGVVGLLRALGAEGPWAVDWRGRALVPWGRGREDSVFLSPRGRARIEALGFEIAAL